MTTTRLVVAVCEWEGPLEHGLSLFDHALGRAPENRAVAVNGWPGQVSRPPTPVPSSQSKPRKVSPNQQVSDERIRSLHGQGKTVLEMASALGLTRQAIDLRLKRLQLPARISRKSPTRPGKSWIRLEQQLAEREMDACVLCRQTIAKGQSYFEDTAADQRVHCACAVSPQEAA